MGGRCRIVDLRGKEVINICDGARLGFPSDVEVDVVTGHLVAIIVPGPWKLFWFFNRFPDYIIPWGAIRRIGDDIILVDFELPKIERRPRKGWFGC